MFVIRVIAALLGFVGLCLGSASASAAVAPSHADVHVVTGTLADGAAYVIRMPHHWTGTLALYGHGLVFPGDWNPAVDSPDELVADFLLDRGVAVAGSSYASAGWAAPDGIADQLATLDQVVHRFGRPARTIAWGQSLGGAIATALVERRSDVVDAALPMCNFGAGSEGLWNHYLDSAFVAKTLLAPHSDLRLTGITDPVANIDRAQQILGGATGTPSGRARLALAAAVAQLPGALRPDLPPPAGVEGRLEARLGWLQAPYLPLAFGVRADVEARAGGNPSTNVGVDYRHELALSGQRADVEALYARAGLSLGADLNRLAAAPRVHADARARAYLQDNVSFTGSLSRPVLTLHDTADGAVPTSHEHAYAAAVRHAGHGALLRQLYTGRPGHCLFTPAEMITAFQALQDRLETGRWGHLDGATLNGVAAALGPELNVGGGHSVPPAFGSHHPLRFPRPDASGLSSGPVSSPRPSRAARP